MVLTTLLVLVFVAADPMPTVSGRVQDAEGRPTGDVEVRLSGIEGQGGTRPVLARARTDDQGRFRIAVPPEADPGRVNLPLALWAHRPGREVAAMGLSRSKLPAGDSIVLKLGAPTALAFRVLGPDGAPEAGARVTPAMLRIEGGLPPSSAFPPPDELAERLGAETDREGRGRLADLTPAAVLAVRVAAPRFGHQGGPFAADDRGVPTLTLAPVGRLAGRVVADDPETARGLTVHARTIPDGPAAPRSLGEAAATTDAAGRFEVPALAAGRLVLGVLPRAGSALQARPPSDLRIEPGRLTEIDIPLKDPNRLRAVSGRVVDRRGAPVAGAIIFQTGDAPGRTQAETDAQGRFLLTGVARGRAFLFARKDGHRFGGASIGPDAREVELTLARRDETTQEMKTLPPPLPHEEELALARRLLDPYADRALKEGDEGAKVRTLEVLALIEPARVLERIDRAPSAMAMLNDMLRLRVAQGLLATSPDEALAVIEAAGDAATRAMGLIEAVDARTGADPARTRDLLDRALVQARAAKDPALRLLVLGQVGERLLDLGEAARSEALLREGQGLAQELPTAAFAGYARGAFAEELAQIDLPAALALTKDLADAREFDRHHGNIAHELAGRDPAGAERVLGMVRDGFQRDQYAVRVVYRMATTDLDRARRLARAIDNIELRAYGFGQTALALAESNKPGALGLLDEAFDELDRAAASGGKDRTTIYSPTSIAGALLPVAERIDPALVPESLWRALALRPPTPKDGAREVAAAWSDAQLAIMLARYDRGLARALLEPLAAPDGLPGARTGGRGDFPVALAVVDPRWAVSGVEGLPDDPDLKVYQAKNAARLAVAAALGRTGQRRWRYLMYHHLGLWVPDIEDIAPNL
jgi:hypothetical protein